jgi:hypothetical protein
LAGVFSTLIVAVLCCTSQVLAADDQYAVVSTGYENHQYEYSVMIPDGFRGFKAKPPAPDNGFFIPLTEGRSAKIDVDANYNTLEYKSVREAASGENAWFVERCASGLRTVSNPTTLGSMAAIFIEVSCMERGSSRSLVLDSVVALRPTNSDYITTVVYSVSLISTQKRHRDDKRVYDRVVRSFKLSEATR